MNHETSFDPICRHLDWRNRPLDSGLYSNPPEVAVMNRESVKRTIEALEEAYYHILTTVPPGTPGKIDAVMRLRNSADNLFVAYSNHNIPRNRTEQVL